MNLYSKQVRTFYENEVARHGLTYKGLGYNQHESQIRRFEVLAAVGDLNGSRVLDVGCGLGDLVRFIWDLGVVPDYTGLDLCEHMITECRKRIERRRLGPARFIVGDVLDFEDFDAPYDYVLSSGIFGLWTPETLARVEPTLERMFGLCKKAVAVNFLSARAGHHAARSLYLQPNNVLDLAWRLTPTVTLRHDYLPNDFTLYLYREPQRLLT